MSLGQGRLHTQRALVRLEGLLGVARRARRQPDEEERFCVLWKLLGEPLVCGAGGSVLARLPKRVRAAFVVIEQEDEGRDDVVIDLSTLRVDVDGPIRARLMELADAHAETILSREDLCEALGEPLEAQVRYIRGLEADVALVESERTTDVFSPEAPSPEAPSPEALASAETAVDEMAARVRAMKDGGATNADETVREAVAALLARKAHLSSLRDAAEAAAPEAAAAAAAEAEANAERWTEEAKRTIQELPIHNLPERYLRFQCADRPTAKALAKAIADEKLYPLLERLEWTDEETAAKAPNEVDSVVVA